MKRIPAVIAVMLVGFLLIPTSQGVAKQQDDSMAIATFAGGCFWCLEPPFHKLEGVKDVIAGYTGGDVKNPTYQEVSSGKTGHLEAAQITYDPSVVSYETLLATFWRNIDPTDRGGQFADRGSQYETAIFYHDDEQQKLAEASKKQLEESGKFDRPIVVKVQPASEFYPAEDYHQDYYKKNPLRYNSYKVGSGRAGFIEKFWKADSTFKAEQGKEQDQ